MTHDIQELVIRHVAPVETAEITRVLTAAMGDGPVARWLNPDPAARRAHGPAYFEIFAEHAVRYGEVYAAVDDATDRLSGVALWFPFTSAIPAPADYETRLKDVSGPAFDRVAQLDAAREARQPTGPHHYLAFLAVHPEHQNWGIGSALLDRHHARIDAAKIPAYLEANDPRNRDLYLRHGYLSRRPAIQLPDGPPIWPMWRPPAS
jgi:GNAT superfamily N-acetyltransferase